MFQQLSQQLRHAFQSITGHGRLTADHLRSALRDVRRALLSADVARSVVDDMITRLESRVLSPEVMEALRPERAFMDSIADELVAVLGHHQRPLKLAGPGRPRIIVMAGLQGSGKTTSTAKLARFLTEQGHRVAVVSCDLVRPGALEQLRVVAEQAGVVCYHDGLPEGDAVERTRQAIKRSQQEGDELLLVDTAGRLHVDEPMMAEMRAVVDVAKPVELLFVMDAMMGQDAARTAADFKSKLPLTGVVLTKLDGDSRGGAALSTAAITGCPILFAGVGEKIDQLERFDASRLAKRILDRGDEEAFVKEIQRHVTPQDQKRLAKRMRKGVYTLEDMRRELAKVRDMGGVSTLINHLPGSQQLAPMVEQMEQSQSLIAFEAVLNSMTLEERLYPDRYFLGERALKQKRSRRDRIVPGAGVSEQVFKQMLSQYKKTAKVMKKMKQPGMRQKMMDQMAGLMDG